MEPCPSCGLSFNLKQRRPVLLPCEHSICDHCFQQLSGSGEIRCPVHIVAHPASCSYDQQKLELLEAWRVPCLFHPAEDAETVCVEHALPLCEQCADCEGASCDMKDLVEKGPEHLRVLLCERVESVWKAHQSLLSVKRTVDCQGVRPKALKDLLDILRKLYKELNPRACSRCSVSNVQHCDLESFKLLCERCALLSRGQFIRKLSDIDFSVADYSQHLHRVASAIHFYELNIEDVDSLQVSTLHFLTRIVNVRKIVKKVKRRQKERNPFQLENYFICPKCRVSSKQKDIPALRRLPCAGAFHAVCEECAERMGAEQESSVNCPLDDSFYPVPVSSLEVILRNPEDFLTDLSTVATSSQEIIGDGHSLAHKGYLIPPFSSREFEAVERYRRVLPALLQEEISDEESKRFSQPWIVNKVQNQVEAISFSASREVVLYGLTLANPKSFGAVATVAWVRVYAGVSAVGDHCDCALRNCELRGGKVSTDVYFRDQVQGGAHYAGVQIPANEPVTLKLRVDTGGKPLAMYHGNHVGRYRHCRGPSGTQWEFGMTEAVEPGEVNGGQHDIISPILRLIYRNVQ